VTDEAGASYRFTRIFVVPNPGGIPEGMDIEEARDKG